MSHQDASNVVPLYPRAAAAGAVDPRHILAVIPALNEERHIEACIRSLMQGSADLRRVPLTIADGGSTDGTVAVVTRLMAEFPNLRLLNNSKRLQSAALNLAAEIHLQPDSRYLVRCDAHSIYPENFILTVCEALERTGAASVVVPMDAVGHTCFERANAWIVDTPLGSGGSAHRGGRVSASGDHGHHAGFHLQWFQRVGGYDETFSHNEDAEYDTRLAAVGGRIWLDSDIRISYIPRGRIRSLARQYYQYGKGRARTVAKHGAKLKIRQTLPILALLASLTGLIASLFFWPAVLIPAAYTCLLMAASVFVAVKKRSLCGLFAGLASGIMHMSWAAGFLRQAVFGRGAGRS